MALPVACADSRDRLARRAAHAQEHNDEYPLGDDGQQPALGHDGPAVWHRSQTARGESQIAAPHDADETHEHVDEHGAQRFARVPAVHETQQRQRRRRPRTQRPYLDHGPDADVEAQRRVWRQRTGVAPVTECEDGCPDGAANVVGEGERPGPVVDLDATVFDGGTAAQEDALQEAAAREDGKYHESDDIVEYQVLEELAHAGAFLLAVVGNEARVGPAEPVGGSLDTRGRIAAGPLGASRVVDGPASS